MMIDSAVFKFEKNTIIHHQVCAEITYVYAAKKYGYCHFSFNFESFFPQRQLE